MGASKQASRSSASPAAGEVFKVRYPFVRDTYTEWDGEGLYELSTWKPGLTYEVVGPEGEADPIAHGEGWQILTVVSTHKPGRFPQRVFYTQQFEDPDGKVFGRTKCRVITTSAFKRRASRFGAIAADSSIADYRVRPPEPTPTEDGPVSNGDAND